MDFDFGNLIYIILTLVFVIFGAMGKKKKPASPPVQDMVDETDQDMDMQVSGLDENLDKLFEDYVESPAETEEISSREEFIQEAEKEKSFSEPGFYGYDQTSSAIDMVENEEGVSTVYRMLDHLEDYQQVSKIYIKSAEKRKASFTQTLYKEFDPKKALLYSEIFKPKYF